MSGRFDGRVEFLTGPTSGIGPGINAICPGIIDTEMMRRFTVGHAMVVDGGQTA